MPIADLSAVITSRSSILGLSLLLLGYSKCAPKQSRILNNVYNMSTGPCEVCLHREGLILSKMPAQIATACSDTSAQCHR
jgi:hypothetical protein